MQWLKESLNRQVVAILVVSMTILGVLITMSENYIISEGDYYREQVKNSFHEATTAAKMQDTFKSQVQDWKNVLIRGNNSQAREKYWNRFEAKETDINNYVKKLREMDKEGKLTRQIDQFETAYVSMSKAYRVGYRTFVTSGYSILEADEQVQGVDHPAGKAIAELIHLLDSSVDESVELEHEAMVNAEKVSLALIVVVLIVSTLVILTLVKRIIVTPISDLSIRVRDYGEGSNVDFELDRNDELGELSDTLSTMQSSRENARMAEMKAAAETLGIKRALDKCQANVMFADTDLVITYVNDSVQRMLSAREQALKTVLPSFNVATLVGTCVDAFHKNPSHQRNMLASLTSVYKTKLKLAGLTFDLIATPVFDDSGTRIGTVVEWDDITESLAKQEEERAIAQENAGIKIALDKCQANVMFANTDLVITYVNDSVIEMLSAREQTLRSALPGFNVKNLVGTCVDDFHKNPAHQRGMLADMKDVYNTRLKLAGLSFDLVATPVFDNDGTRLGTVVEWEDMTEQLAAREEELRVANANMRVKQALDTVTANTMMADADGQIIYANDAVINMLRAAESDVRKALPSFSADKVVGSNFDIFHKNPSHQRNLLSGLKTTYSTQIEVAGRTFALIANPIVNEQEERLGTVVEWADRTEEVKAEREIGNLIEGAAKGDLSIRLETSGKEGFFRIISDGLNELVSIAEGVINDAARVLDAMSHGKLTEKIETDYQGIFGKLKQDANVTSEKLSEIISQIRQSSVNVSSAADEIAQGNADLSQRTEEQASSLEETASSMEEMTSAVKQSADNAVEANKLADEAKIKAQEGGDVVSNAVEAMQEINVASKKISDIIGVIDEIAFQTNLLALNAAVEAARAGEQGRGFAVVAGEVRNLAQRSAGAAKEIKDLIRDSVSKVEDGTALVNESGNTLSEIVSAVERVTEMVADISNAAQEQTSGIDQVNTAIGQMDEMTQQNAALVEEASAAAEAMAEQSRNMSNLVGFFTLGEEGRSSAPIVSPVAAPAPAAPSVNVPTSGTPQGMDVSNSDDDWDEF